MARQDSLRALAHVVVVRGAWWLGFHDALSERLWRLDTAADGDRTAAAAPEAYARGYALGEDCRALAGLDLRDLFTPTAGDTIALRGEG